MNSVKKCYVFPEIHFLLYNKLQRVYCVAVARQVWHSSLISTWSIVLWIVFFIPFVPFWNKMLRVFITATSDTEKKEK